MAERAKATTLATEVQEQTIQNLHPTSASGARLLKSGLAIGDWDDSRGLASQVIISWVRHPVSLAVSRPVSLENKARQGFKAHCLGHVWPAVSLSSAVSLSHLLGRGTVRQRFVDGSAIK
jgi:hypothetical protein